MLFSDYNICYISYWYDGFEVKNTFLAPEIEQHEFKINVQNAQGNDENSD